MLKTQRPPFARTLIALFILFLIAGFTAADSYAELESVKGKVKGFANPAQSKTISVEVNEKDIIVFKYNKETTFENFKSLTTLKGQGVIITYKTSGNDKIASSIKLAFVKVPEGAVEIKAPEMIEIVQKGPGSGIYIIDARPGKRYEEGHIPFAVSIPVSKLVKEGEKLLPKDKNTPLVLYCGGPTCGMSPKAAGLALKWGYSNVKVFLDGEPAWKKAGYCTTSTPDFVKTGNVVLIDLRTPDAVVNGHIPGAVNITADKLAFAKSEFPQYKGANIVFYSDNIPELRKSVQTARKWGYKNSSIFLGGTDAWAGNGLKIEKGPSAAKIHYVRKISPNEISIADFKKEVETGSSVIVDVRTASEFAAGHFKNAVNIPVDDMGERYAELPRDRTLYAHCITGVRAEMAYNILKEHGYNIKYLDAEPVFNADGTYTITE